MADHSKFDILEFYAVATLSCIITILSDSSLSTIDRRYQKEGCMPSCQNHHQARVNGNQANEQNRFGALTRITKTTLATHQDDAHLADGEEILQVDHLAFFLEIDDDMAIS